MDNLKYGRRNPSGKTQYTSDGLEIIDVISSTEFYPVLYRVKNSDSKNPLYGIVKSSGEVVIPVEYKDIQVSWAFDDETPLFVATSNREAHLFDVEGRNFLPTDTTQKFHDIRPVDDELLIFMHNGDYGIINYEGSVLVEPVYKNIIPLKNSRFIFEGRNYETEYSRRAILSGEAHADTHY